MLRKSLFVGLVVWAIAASLGFASRASAQVCTADEAVKPWFLIVFDTSGSMAFDPQDIANSCGFTPLHKNSAARCAVQNIVNSTPDAEFGLIRFDSNQCDKSSGSAELLVEIDSSGGANILPWVDGDTGAPGELGADSFTPLGGSLALAQEYFEGALAPGNPAPSVVNPTALGCRPVNVILLTDGQEICDDCPGGPYGCPKAQADAFGVIDPLSCSSSCTVVNNNGEFVTAPERAYELLTEMDLPGSPSDDCTGGSPDPGCVNIPIRTYVIGFGIPDGDDRIEDIAIAGGTDNSLDGPGGLRAFYAGNEADLSEAFARIIFESQLSETCDGVDNDCDSFVDEDNPTFCDIDGIRSENPRVIDPDSGIEVFQDEVSGSNLTELCSGAGCESVAGTPGEDVCDDATCYEEKEMSCSPVNKLCESPGEVCDQQDNDCDGVEDEGPFNELPPPEDCSTPIDDDCDDKVNEGCPPSCPPESCNDNDDDCDGRVDEGLTRSCGFAIGACTIGEQICLQGEWGAFCTGGDSGAACDVDDTGVDRSDTDPPPPGDWTVGGGTCVRPTAEICDDVDNDCNFAVDDGIARVACIPDVNPADGVDDWVAQGICSEGTAACDYNGPDDMYGACEFFTGPGLEICDNLDNDCDGFVDEAPGSGVPRSMTRSCGTDLGICTPGTQTCTMGGAPVFNDRWDTCTGITPGTEVCNYMGAAAYDEAFDEDCDGRLDESDPLVPEAPNPPLDCVPDVDGSPLLSDPTTPDLSSGTDTGLCAFGTIQCIDGDLECRGYVGPTDELCDDQDHDCDGGNTTDGGSNIVPNEGNPGADPDTDPSLGGLCIDLSVFSDPGPSAPGYPEAQPGIGSCTLGTLVCDLMDEVPVCVGGGGPSDETCDNTDEDCDGPVDEDAIAASTPCQTGDDPGNPNRVGGALPFPGPGFRQYCARCVDTDGDIVVCRESLIGAACTDAQFNGGAGYGAATSWGGVGDCCADYTRQSAWNFGNLEGLHDGEGECALGNLVCLAGQETCSGEITPTNEECDGLDNDCDGVIDEDVPVGMPCGSSIGICEEGTLQCPIVAVETPGKDYVCVGGVGPADMELCDGLDNNCNGFVDEGNPEGGAACGGNSENCTRPEDPTNPSSPQVPCGDCEFGVEICVTLTDGGGLPIGGEVQCLGDTGPRDEVCDGRDNDCDSQCLVEDDGDIICPGGPTDSDDKIDEELSADDRIGDDCGEDEGECEFGQLVCTGGGVVCQGGQGPVMEICDGLDNDCDGSKDEGIPVGAACFTLGEDASSEPLGECQPGNWICDPDNGMLECEGQIGPTDEECDNLDNDCDGLVDEGLGLGEECGTDEGQCEKGRFRCINGNLVCQGEVTPTPETCDCQDNDCDGEIDEEGDNPLCPSGASCVMCQCALPCTEAAEFAVECPQGKAPVAVDDECFCVGEQCRPSECAEETVELEGEVRCEPDNDRLAPCTCKNNECVPICNGVVCQDGLVCDRADGRCKQPSCLLGQFACEDGQRCQREGATWSCVDDPCANVDCAADESCRAGVCLKSCATVECDSGNKCEDGNCVTDHCFGVQCGAGQVCDPSDGECVLAGACVRTGCADGDVCDRVGGECSEDPCLSTRCPRGQQCNSEDAQCELRCSGGLIFCDDACVNPQTSKAHCGASADCLDGNAGSACADEEVCSEGECSDSCADGLLNCGGECINPESDQMHCGASGDCSGSEQGETCQTGFTCMEGRCRSILGGDGDSDGDEVEATTHVIASGGGGCTCTVPVGAVVVHGDAGDSKRGPLALGLIGLALLALARRRRFAVLRGMLCGVGVTHVLLLVLLALLLLSGGCKVDTFCIDCEDQNGGGDGDGDGIPPLDLGDSGMGGTGRPGGDGDTIDPMPMVDGGPIQPDACTPIEVCNGIDDDCDGTADEDVDPVAQGLDYDTDVDNCGGCGNRCQISHAFAACVSGSCRIDRDQGEGGCDVGFHDLDGQEDNGCEYRCTESSDEDAICDLLDNDCDGEVDEDIAFGTDPNNCGSCGFTCKFANATDGGTCVNEVCLLDDTKCNDGFKNLDGNDDNGCERRCDVWPTVDELCNLLDDDCDGRTNEGVAATDPEVDQPCGIDTGLCEFGTTECRNGAVECIGGVTDTVEVCDDADNDCDGNVDESDPTLASNPRCGTAIGICELGELVCNDDGDIVCGGPNLIEPEANETCNNLDDDCDGRIDEHVVAGARNLDDGYKCSVLSGSLEIFDPGASATGECAYGNYVCIGGTLTCQGEVGPSPELCDNLDHDCDGEPVTADLADLAGPEPLGDTCGNQLGICTPGVSTCVNSGTDVAPNWGVTGCEGGFAGLDHEECNLVDDDCDGVVNDPGDMQLGDPEGDCWIEDVDADFIVDEFRWGDNDTGRCSTGSAICSTQGGGTFICIGYQGPRRETCDGVDEDCDTNVDEDAQFVGQPCAVDPASGVPYEAVGRCVAGTWACVDNGGKVLECQGGTPPLAQEYCNGIDDNCNRSVDEGWVPEPGMGQDPAGTPCCPDDPDTPYVDVCDDANPSCGQGAVDCRAGNVQCVADPAWAPDTEVCDGVDNDCDGIEDEDFKEGGLQGGAYTSLSNCGSCGNDCGDIDPATHIAVQICNDTLATPACEIAIDPGSGRPVCDPGWTDDPLSGGVDCDYECTFLGTGVEFCDGLDNDCDGSVDETADLMAVAPDVDTFCLTDGACAAATVECGFNVIEGVFRWDCTDQPADFIDGCADPEDEDCDGLTDEDATSLVAGVSAPIVRAGEMCQGPGVGECRVDGTLACEDGGDGLTLACVDGLGAELTEGAADDEVCDGLDNDCDGKDDEPCYDQGVCTDPDDSACIADNICAPDDTACIDTNLIMPGSILGCSMDSWRELDSGVFIHAYEAGRPDATSTAAGSDTHRACSSIPSGDTGRRPWVNISYSNAVAACEAVGARLCTRSEWREGCDCGGTGPSDYGWSDGSGSADACTSVATSSPCNFDSNNDGSSAGVMATPTNADCYTEDASSAPIYDLNGNVREYTLASNEDGFACRLTDSDCKIMTRGGAENSFRVGAACGYENSFWGDDAPFPNIGFRCCYGPAPAESCVTITSTDTPITVGNGGDAVSTLVVSGVDAMFAGLTDIQISINGRSTDADDLDWQISDGTTTLNLADAENCDNNLDISYKLQFRDAASGFPSMTGPCSDIKFAEEWDASGGSIMSAFPSADHTWTLRSNDDSSSRTQTLQDWALRFCGTLP